MTDRDRWRVPPMAWALVAVNVIAFVVVMSMVLTQP